MFVIICLVVVSRLVSVWLVLEAREGTGRDGVWHNHKRADSARQDGRWRWVLIGADGRRTGPSDAGCRCWLIRVGRRLLLIHRLQSVLVLEPVEADWPVTFCLALEVGLVAACHILDGVAGLELGGNWWWWLLF